VTILHNLAQSVENILNVKYVPYNNTNICKYNGIRLLEICLPAFSKITAEMVVKLTCLSIKLLVALLCGMNLLIENRPRSKASTEFYRWGLYVFLGLNCECVCMCQ
jgi:hypothetical protein